MENDDLDEEALSFIDELENQRSSSAAPPARKNQLALAPSQPSQRVSDPKDARIAQLEQQLRSVHQHNVSLESQLHLRSRASVTAQTQPSTTEPTHKLHKHAHHQSTRQEASAQRKDPRSSADRRHTTKGTQQASREEPNRKLPPYFMFAPTQQSAYSSLSACEGDALETIASSAAHSSQGSSTKRPFAEAQSQARLVLRQADRSEQHTTKMAARVQRSLRQFAGGTVSLRGIACDLAALASAAVAEQQSEEVSAASRASAHLLLYSSGQGCLPFRATQPIQQSEGESETRGQSAGNTHSQHDQWSTVPPGQCDRLATEFAQCARGVHGGNAAIDCLRAVKSCMRGSDGLCEGALHEAREMLVKRQASDEVVPPVMDVLASTRMSSQQSGVDAEVIDCAYGWWCVNVGRYEALMLMAQGSNRMTWSMGEAFLRQAGLIESGAEQHMSVHLATVGIRDGCLGSRDASSFTEADVRGRYACEKIADGLTRSEDSTTRRSARRLAQRLRETENVF